MKGCLKVGIVSVYIFCLTVVMLLTACSKGSEANGGNPPPTQPAVPSDLIINTQVVGASSAMPDGDGSGEVNLSLSGNNVTSFTVTLPSENKTFNITGASGSVTLTFASAPGTTSQYTISVSAFNNNIKKDTAVFVTVYCKPVGQDLVWSDEFDGTSLDTDIWNYESGNNNGWGNNELEYYTSDAANVSVQNGSLQITALNSPNYNNTGFNYTSARITTQNKKTFKYGRIDIRAKIPGDNGTWPALWMLGSNIASVPWPACGEIDIMEAGTVTGFENILSSLHWGQDVSKSQKVSGATTGFHLYSIDWRADHIAFYIDSTLFYSQPNNSALPFNQNFFFIFNVAVGGNMGGNNIDLSDGSTMYVDYIRVYN